MPTIRHIHSTIDSLADLQKNMVDAVAGEISSVDADISEAARALRANVQAIVPAGNDERYADLTRAARQAGAGHDFTALVAQWTAEDETNRRERAELETAWGTRASVAEKTAAVKEELSIVNSALKDVSPEIEAFDQTTTRINTHNQDYPKAQITEENHDGYEKFGLGRFLLWLTFINRGPHKAYKIVSAYNNEYGDFYEDARDIAKLRENEKALLGSKTEKEGVRDQLTAIGSRMDTLDGSYRGPDGIARDVAGIVAREVKDDPAFAAALCQAVPGDETRTAALSAIKIRAFDRVKSFLNTELEQVKATLTDLRRPLDNLQNALGRVGGNNIYYDVDDAESAINRGVRVTREAVRDAEGAREAIAGYEVRGTTFNADRAENEINRYADLNARGNEIDLDFSDLERKVDNEVEDYEREQARIREQQRLARERAAAEARAAREALERLNSRRSTPTASIDFGSSSRSSSSGGLSRGTGGIASRSNDSVSRGTSGIKPRI